MSTREYIGARYVPVFANPLDWNASNTYEPLTVVLHQGNSFTSMRAVPAGIDISNTSYWAQTGNYNAQIEQYRQEVQSLLPTVPVSKGGTGATTAADALVALGAAESGGATNTLYDAEQAIAENAADIADLQDSVAYRSQSISGHIINVQRFGRVVNINVNWSKEDLTANVPKKLYNVIPNWAKPIDGTYAVSTLFKNGTAVGFFSVHTTFLEFSSTVNAEYVDGSITYICAG